MKDTDEFKNKNKSLDDTKAELQRFIFYFERFDNHRKSQEMIKKLKPVIVMKIRMLHDIKNFP